MRRGGGDAPVLEADGIGKSFGTKHVLGAASLGVDAGSITALVGRNGVGKTTLLRVMAGLVRADHGRVLLRGSVRSRPRLHHLAREGLMYASQASALTPLFTLRHHLSAFARAYDRAATAVEEAVGRMRLEEVIDRRPDAVSGGERQRATLAMALVREPACLLADEPFAGVAPRDRPLVADAVRVLADAGCGVVVSGHDVEDVFAVADRVVWMTAGTTHELGSPDEARLHHQFRTEYLGPDRLA